MGQENIISQYEVSTSPGCNKIRCLVVVIKSLRVMDMKLNRGELGEEQIIGLYERS